jgi:hypothetical protein
MPTSFSILIEAPATDPTAILATCGTYPCELADPVALDRHAPKTRRRPLARRANPAAGAAHQLSLAELMGLITFVCTLFGGFCWLSRGGFAGLAGIATVLSLRVIESDEAPLVMRLAWWALLGTYLTAAAMAFWNL